MLIRHSLSSLLPELQLRQFLTIRQLPEKTFERLRLSYEKFLASAPNEQDVERHNVVPHDGFRSGNAWEGIASVPGHIKVFRG